MEHMMSVDVTPTASFLTHLNRQFDVVEFLEIGLDKPPATKPPPHDLAERVARATWRRWGEAAAIIPSFPKRLYFNGLSTWLWMVIKPKMPQSMALQCVPDWRFQVKQSTRHIAVLAIPRPRDAKLVIVRAGQEAADAADTIYTIPTRGIRIQSNESDPYTAFEQVWQGIVGSFPEDERAAIRSVTLAVVEGSDGWQAQSPIVLVEALAPSMRISVVVIYWKALKTYRTSYSVITRLNDEGITTVTIAEPTLVHKEIDRQVRQLIADRLQQERECDAVDISKRN